MLGHTTIGERWDAGAGQEGSCDPHTIATNAQSSAIEVMTRSATETNPNASHRAGSRHAPRIVRHAWYEASGSVDAAAAATATGRPPSTSSGSTPYAATSAARYSAAARRAPSRTTSVRLPAATSPAASG